MLSMQIKNECYFICHFIYCVRGYFRGGFIFFYFASQTARKFPLQFMSIYSNENIRKITKLTPREFPHLVQNHENICTRKLWRIQYVLSDDVMNSLSYGDKLQVENIMEATWIIHGHDDMI